MNQNKLEINSSKLNSIKELKKVEFNEEITSNDKKMLLDSLSTIKNISGNALELKVLLEKTIK